MKLITKTLEKRFQEVGSQEHIADPIVIAKFFTPVGGATWYATEYDPEERICFGYVTGLGGDEFGYFSVDELESVKLPFGLTIERDLYSGEKHLSEFCPELKPFINERLKNQQRDAQRMQELDQIQETRPSQERDQDMELER